MRRVQATDPVAFGLLYDRLAPAALGLAFSVTRNRRQAEDVAQEAFLSAWRNRDSFDPARGNAKSWLLAIVRNRGLDALRRAAARDETWEELDDHERADAAAADPLLEVARNDEARTVRQALKVLPVEQATVLTLAYFAGLSQSEIAERLGVPLGTVKGRARAGLRRLASELASVASPASLPAAP